MITMERLPIEIISHIMTFLPSGEDRKAASLTCKLWNAAYQSSEIKKLEVLIINKAEVFEKLSGLPKTNCIYVNVEISGILVDDSFDNFWAKYGPYVKNLGFKRCQIREDTFLNLIKKCEGLRHLTIQNCNEMFTNRNLFENEVERNHLKGILVNLKCLDLGYNRNLSDLDFVRFTSVCPNIKELLLPGCPIIFRQGLDRRFENNVSANPSDTVLTFNVIHNFIKQQAANLKVISLSGTRIDPDSLSELVSTPDLVLDELHLRACYQLWSELLGGISDHQHYLTVLDIGLCSQLGDESVINICRHLTGLKHFSIEGCKNVTDHSISEVWRLTEIVKLNISKCQRVTDVGISRGLGSRINTKLEDLNLCGLVNVTDRGIIQIIDWLPNLRVLNLGNCNLAVTDRSVKSICLGLRHLTKLCLARAYELTDRGVTGIQLDTYSNDLSTLEDLNIVMRRLYEVSDSDSDEIEEDENQLIARSVHENLELRVGSLRKLKNLRYLDLSFCNYISDMSLVYGLQIRELRYLDVSYCRRLTDKGLKILSENNIALEMLNLNACLGIGDDGVNYLISNLARLKVLSIQYTRVTERILNILGPGKSKLRYLDLRHCSELTQETIGQVISQNPLTHVFCSGPHEIIGGTDELYIWAPYFSFIM